MTPSSKNGTIGTPFTRRLRIWGKRYVPILGGFCVAVGLLILAAYQGRQVTVTGVVELPQVYVAPLMNGVIRQLSVDLLDEVQAGQVVALMDDRIIKSELASANAELARLQAQLASDQERLHETAAAQERKNLDAQRRFAMNEEEARLEHLQLAAQQESDEVDLQRLRLLKERETALIAKKMTTQEAYDDARLRYEALEKRVKENKATLEASSARLKETGDRQKALAQEPMDMDLERILDPMRKSIGVQEAVIDEIQERRKKLALTAPASGCVTALLKRDGETVLSGQPILSLRMNASPRVIAYFDEKAMHEIAAGAKAALSSRNRPELTTAGEVLRVGGEIVPFPARLQTNPAAPQYGVELLLGSLKDPVFHPGELVNVTIDLTGSTGTGPLQQAARTGQRASALPSEEIQEDQSSSDGIGAMAGDSRP